MRARSVLGSLIIHALIIIVLALAEIWNVNRLAQPEPEKTVLIVELQPESVIKKRIVETEQGEIVKVAPKNAYLSDANRKVEKESVSNKGESVLKKLGVPLFDKEHRLLSKESQQRERDFGNYGSDYSQVKGEYVKGIKEGEQTALNTKEYVFFSYFQRIRERLDLAWRPILKDQITRIYYSGRNIASDMDHTTATLVTLNAQGEVTHVQVVSESGTKDLDDAAIKAFNKAGPFPNPPIGLLDHSGKVQVRWDFILKT